RRARHVRQLLHRPRGCERLDCHRRAAVEADLSVATATASWPGLSRPSTPCTQGEDVDARHKAGHDGGKAHGPRMADVALKSPASRAALGEPGAWSQLKTNRNWLGFWFMLPAAAFLILF